MGESSTLKRKKRVETRRWSGKSKFYLKRRLDPMRKSGVGLDKKIVSEEKARADVSSQSVMEDLDFTTFLASPEIKKQGWET